MKFSLPESLLRMNENENFPQVEETDEGRGDRQKKRQNKYMRSMEILTLALVTLLAQAPEIIKRVHKKNCVRVKIRLKVFLFLVDVAPQIFSSLKSYLRVFYMLVTFPNQLNDCFSCICPRRLFTTTCVNQK